MTSHRLRRKPFRGPGFIKQAVAGAGMFGLLLISETFFSKPIRRRRK